MEKSRIEEVLKLCTELSQTIPHNGSDAPQWMKKMIGLCIECENDEIKKMIPVSETGNFSYSVEWLSKKAACTYQVSRNVKISSKLLELSEILKKTIDTQEGSMPALQPEAKIEQTIYISGNHTGHIVGLGSASGNINNGHDFLQFLLQRITDEPAILPEQKNSLIESVKGLLASPILANILASISLAVPK